MTVRHVMVVFGTRPEAIKMAPLLRALDAHPALEPVVAVTAQHRQMLDQVTRLFDIRPDFDLNVIQPLQSLVDVTHRSLSGIHDLISARRVDAVVVQGDTTTTFAGALAAFYQQVPVVHLEAGLRTFNRYSPFPEEVNRRLTTQLTSLHLAATAGNRDNLLAEGVDRADVVVTGNTVIDALLHAVELRAPYDDPALEVLDRTSRRMLLVTAHRRESWGSPMADIARAVAKIADQEPELLIVLPLHKNPVVREVLLPALQDRPNVLLTEPQAYGSFARLMHRSHVILSDSGGVQEEGPSLGKPVLVMRETTERPEAVEAGAARLVGTNSADIVDAVLTLLHDRHAYDRMSRAVNPYGDGLAAPRAAAAISELVGVGSRLPEFTPVG